MKRVIIVSAVMAMILVGCKDDCCDELGKLQKKSTQSATNLEADNDVNAEKNAINRLIKGYGVYVSRKCAPEVLYYNSDCTTEFDVSKFVNDEDDSQKTKLAAWLKTNGSKICFPKSDDFIECIHRVTDDTAREQLRVLGQPVGTINITEIIEAAENHPDNINYRTDYYKHYVKLNIENGQVRPQIVNNFDPTGGCYSMPFIRILVDLYGEDQEDVSIEIREAKIYYCEDGIPKRFLCIQEGSETHYYDFSQIPTIALDTNTILHYAFSPL